jgi:hypothetical protein
VLLSQTPVAHSVDGHGVPLEIKQPPPMQTPEPQLPLVQSEKSGKVRHSVRVICGAHSLHEVPKNPGLVAPAG